MRQFNKPCRGVALVVVLGIVALITILIVAYVSAMRIDLLSSKNYSDNVRTQELALGGINWVLTDLAREIQSGSSLDPNDGKPGVNVEVLGRRVFFPIEKVGSGSLPDQYPSMRVLKFVSDQEEILFPNLLRRSLRPSAQATLAPGTYTMALYPDPSNVGQPVDFLAGSDVAASDPALSGRKTNFVFWNKPLLLNPDLSQADKDKFLQPDWMLVTRKGVKVFADTPSDTLKAGKPGTDDFVLGRIAYVLYDVGGLLDANVSGNLLSFDENKRRGWGHQVDLSTIPGVKISGGKPDYVSWRWPVTGAMSDPSVPWSLFDAKRTFLSVAPLVNGGKRDNCFLGRSDLIRYAKESGALEEVSLEFFTTFSRDLNQPSWSPTDVASPLNAPIYSYETNAGLSKNQALSSISVGGQATPVVNRNLLMVRWSRDQTIKTWEGTSLDVKKGDPVFARRFPLGKLDLFRQYAVAVESSNGAEADRLKTEIKYAFGLVPDINPTGAGLTWDFSNDPRRWRYDFSQTLNKPGSTGPNARRYGRILSLDQIEDTTLNLEVDAHKNEAREPNFFEILQAVILSGELGLGFGPEGDLTTRATQALAIGANIIDQYDEDNYPTLIRTYAPKMSNFQDNAGTAPYLIDNDGKVVAGVENLPYLSEALFRIYRLSPTGNTVRAWMEFELWNPHANAGAADRIGNGPTEFRVVAVDGASIVLVSRNNNAAGTGTPTIQPDFGSVYGDTTPFQLPFDYTSVKNYKEPTLLQEPQVVGTVHADNKITASAQTRLGIFMGETDAPLTPRQDQAVFKIPSALGGVRPVIFDLQFKNKLGVWTTMQKWQYNRLETAGGVWNTGSADSMTYTSGFPTSAYSSGTSPAFTTFPYFLRAFSVVDPRISTELVSPLIQMMGGQASPGQTLLPTTAGGPLFYDYDIGFSGVYATASNTSNPKRTQGSDNNRSMPGYLMANSGGYRQLRLHGRDTDFVRLTDFASVPPASMPTIAGNSSSRPYHLNRPFRSVGELGLVFRDLPGRSINFSETSSSDAGLADAFSIQETLATFPMLAGRINLNSAREEVLEAIISGSEKKPGETQVLSASEASSISESLHDRLRDGANGPLRHRSDVSKIGSAFLGSATNKWEREAPLRALLDMSQTRTWNLMIDLVAQTGQYPSGAKSLKDFTVTAEKRYWVHLAIDRFSGKVVDQQIEQVSE